MSTVPRSNGVVPPAVRTDSDDDASDEKLGREESSRRHARWTKRVKRIASYIQAAPRVLIATGRVHGGDKISAFVDSDRACRRHSRRSNSGDVVSVGGQDVELDAELRRHP